MRPPLRSAAGDPAVSAAIVAVDGTAGQLSYDLAVDASGAGMPSAVDAGLVMPGTPMVLGGPDLGRLLLALGFAALGLYGIGLIARARPSSRLAG